ncbi:MAG: hypothetical protein ABI777_04815 [Betaproteobacteria bacterium]
MRIGVQNPVRRTAKQDNRNDLVGSRRHVANQGSLTWRAFAISAKERSLSTAIPFPWVMMSSVLNFRSGNSALPRSVATALCLEGVLQISSGRVALHPLAMTRRSGLSTRTDILFAPQSSILSFFAAWLAQRGAKSDARRQTGNCAATISLRH